MTGFRLGAYLDVEIGRGSIVIGGLMFDAGTQELGLH